MKTFICSLLLIAMPGLAQAAPPSDASIARLLELAQTRQLVEQIRGQVQDSFKPMVDQAMAGRTLTPEQKKRSDEMVGKMAKKMDEILADELSWPMLEEFYTMVYRESFTQEEIDGLIAFYDSPAGRAFVAKMPLVTQRSMQFMQQRMGPMMQRIQQAVREVTTEMEQKRAGGKT